MDISLQKCGGDHLFKRAIIFKHVIMGFGSDTRSSDDVDINLDTSIFIVIESGRVRSGIGYGYGYGYDLALKMKIVKIPAKTSQRVLDVPAYKAQVCEQSLCMMPDAFIRFVNYESKVDVTLFNFSEDYSTKTSTIFGETYCHDGECKFKAVGQDYAGGLRALAIQHGVNIQ